MKGDMVVLNGDGSNNKYEFSPMNVNICGRNGDNNNDHVNKRCNNNNMSHNNYTNKNIGYTKNIVNNNNKNNNTHELCSDKKKDGMVNSNDNGYIFQPQQHNLSKITNMVKTLPFLTINNPNINIQQHQ